MSFTKNVFSVFQRDFIIYLLNIFTGVLIARILGAHSLGIWALMQLIPSYAEGFGRMKVDLAFVYFNGQKKYTKEDLLINAILINIFTSVFTIGIILFQFENIYSWLFRTETANFRLENYILITVIPLQFIYLNIVYFHISNSLINIYNKMVIIQAILNIAIVIILLFASFGLWSLILGSIISTFASLLFGIYSIEKKTWLVGKLNKDIVSSLIKYGSKFYLTGITGQLQQSGTQLITSSILIPSQIAFLNQGQAIGRLVNKIVDPINIILYPYVSNVNNNSINMTCKAFRQLFIILLFACFFLFLFARPLIFILYGKEFLATIPVINILLPSLILSGLSTIILNYFNGTGNAHYGYRLQILPLIIQLFLAFFLTKKYGLIGASFSIAIGVILNFILVIFKFRSITKIQLKYFVPTYTDIKELVLIFNHLLKEKIMRRIN